MNILDRLFIDKKRLYYVFVSIFGALILLNIIDTLYFNDISGDDASFANHAVNVMQKRWGSDLFGDLLGRSSYWFAYPVIYPCLTALSFKVFGINYEVAKIVPLSFYIINIVAFYYYLKSKFDFKVVFVLLFLLLCDHLFFTHSHIVRPEMVVILVFTCSVLMYKEGEDNKSSRMIFLSGIIAGVSLLTSLNALWLVMSVILYKIVSKSIVKDKKIILIYLAGFMVFTLPYYCWIMADNERSISFFQQLFHYSSAAEGNSVSFLIKKLLNPIADLYLITFRWYSAFSIIFCCTMIYFLFNFKKHSYFFCVLIVPFIMMVVNRRASNYLLLTMPVCYVAFGHVLVDLNHKKRYITLLKAQKIFIVVLLFVMIVGLKKDLTSVLKKPSLVMDISYYKKILEDNTEKNAIIVTDPALTLSSSEGRKIITVGTLIWDRWRMVYPYDEIFRILDPDYVLLTERKKKWGEQDHPQTVAFQKLLTNEFFLDKTISHDIYGKLWLYKRERFKKDDRPL